MPGKLWSTLCSLKLAIVLASAATLTTMAGSLLIPFRPAVFASMDRMVFGDWLRQVGLQSFSSTWWVFVAICLLFLLGINTFCCFCDWLRQIRGRWRKGGEYLIHLGFVLVVIAFVIGSLGGFRSEGNRLREGQTIAIPGGDGLFLRLDHFEPLFSAEGQFLDMINELTLLSGDNEIVRQTVRINHPLIAEGLVILPASFGREATGFRMNVKPGQEVALSPGRTVDMGEGRRMRVLDFYPHARRDRRGRAVPQGEELGDPAFALELITDNQIIWRGWYFLRQGLPPQLRNAGVDMRPLAPLYAPYTILTINRDPGAPLALAGCLAMGVGVFFALFSYYAKRRRKDRPQV